MRKKFISMALTAMLLTSSLVSNVNIANAADITNDNQADSQVQEDLEQNLAATAGYVMDRVSDRISAGDYNVGYNDYIQAMLALKAGVENDHVVEVLTERLQEEGNGILNPASADTASLSIAAAILFLNETGQNPADFGGMDLTEKLYDIYMSASGSNPYTYQYVNAAALQCMEDAGKLTDILNKIKTEVESIYVDGENGTGIDYWGVSVDNNANVLSSLYLQYALDSDIYEGGSLGDLLAGIEDFSIAYEGVYDKVQASLEWSLAQCDESWAVVSWGSPNASSTGLALRLASEFGDYESAEHIYQATEQFQSSATEGVYTYNGRDSDFATVDMLWGMLSFDRALDGYWVFDPSSECIDWEEVSDRVSSDLSETASYMMGNLKESLAQEDYQLNYNDYIHAMLSVKAGAVDKSVIELLNAALKEEAAAYDDTFLNPYQSSGVKSLSLAAAILYLEEAGENPYDFAGLNLVDQLYHVYMEETDMNPYALQYVNAVIMNSYGDEEENVMFDEMLDKIREDVLSFYVNDENGTGIDYWGVSVDNNANVLSALSFWYLLDDELTEKIEAALEWNLTQRDESGAVVSWGSANSSSTALGLRMSAEFYDVYGAYEFYQALAQFKSDVTPGMYTYNGADSIYSTQDALWGLLAFRNMLDGEDLFAVSGHYVPEPEDETEPETTVNPEEKPEGESEKTPVSPSTSGEPEVETTMEASSPAVPDTGDNSHGEILFALAALAALAASTMVRKHEKY